jgi:SAM-dependent methyltransferase
VTCTVCGAAGLPLFYTQGDRRQFQFYRCPQCRLVVYDRSAGVSQEKYLLRAVDPARAGQGPGHRQTYAFIRRWAKPGRLLDLGCGDGGVLWLARRDGWEVEGVELFAEQAALVRERLGVPVAAADIMTYEGARGAWDVVLLRHVLEHLPDPVRALAKIRDLLAPGGAAILEFPNIDALDARVRRALDRWGVHRRHYAATYRPGHVHEFCRASFAYAAARAGLVVERWETYAMHPLKYALYRVLPMGNKARVLARRAA